MKRLTKNQPPASVWCIANQERNASSVVRNFIKRYQLYGQHVVYWDMYIVNKHIYYQTRNGLEYFSIQITICCISH